MKIFCSVLSFGSEASAALMLAKDPLSSPSRETGTAPRGGILPLSGCTLIEVDDPGPDTAAETALQV